MNCQDFETRLADALGDEMGSADRVAFDNHLKQCAECRRDYESATKTIGAMRSLPDHPAIPIERIGDRLVIGAASGSAQSRRFRFRRAAPIAAAIALAFASGYLARDAQPGTARIADILANTEKSRASARSASLESVLADALARDPERSPLAGLSAMFGGRRSQ